MTFIAMCFVGLALYFELFCQHATHIKILSIMRDIYPRPINKR